ncbi:MAG: TSUP family transporter [Pseudomonadota bacterium]
MTDLLALPVGTAWLAVVTVVFAGAVRGFAGFGLSAIIMAALAPVVPPIDLIPVCWALEMVAATILTRGGYAEADRPAALTLTLTAFIGLPAGLAITRQLDPTGSGVLALLLILALCAAILLGLRIPWLATRAGTAAAGTGAGVAAGLAGVGGLAVALYALVRDLPPRAMRGTLILYVLGGGLAAFLVFLATGVLTAEAIRRAGILAIPALLGTFLGRALFTPRWERFYKPFCLTLLIGLSALGLIRLAMGGS